MASVGTIRDGLKTRLATIAGLNAYDVWPDQPVAPAAMVRFVESDELVVFSGQDARMTFEIAVVVALAAGLDHAQDTLDPYISSSGSSSVRVAIEGDGTLSGAADYAKLGAWRDYNTAEVLGKNYLGAVCEVDVWAT